MYARNGNILYASNNNLLPGFGTNAAAAAAAADKGDGDDEHDADKGHEDMMKNDDASDVDVVSSRCYS